MYEMGLSFNAYIKEYGLERAEGVVLRYLSEAFRVLQRTVPESAKTDEVLDLIDWLGGELKATDASLLEEWQRMSDPNFVVRALEEDTAPEEADITRDKRAFTVLLRNEVWRIVQGIARRDFGRVVDNLRDLAPRESGWTAESLAEKFSPYFEEYAELRTDPSARSPKHLTVEQQSDTWQLQQMLVDPEEDLGWALSFAVDLAASREAGKPVFLLKDVLVG
jgi:hypothetical protein